MTATQRIADAWGNVRSQWVAAARLRWGVLAIVAILWLYGLLVLGDVVQSEAQANATLRDEIGRTVPLARERAWPARADEARKQLEAMQVMLWGEGDIGLAEAAFQDWVRSTAGKAGLTVRELTVARAAEPAPSTLPAQPVVAATPRPRRVNAHLSVELARVPLMAFLSEVARNEKIIVVDRLILRAVSQPPSADIDLHVLAAAPAAAK